MLGIPLISSGMLQVAPSYVVVLIITTLTMGFLEPGSDPLHN
jgi:hypothetical protein